MTFDSRHFLFWIIDRSTESGFDSRHLTEALPVIPKNKETLKIFARAYGARYDLLSHP